ncbi:cytochrome c oxidase subunit II [Pseudanabaena sp. FACHB-2040]|uniref:cytochrome c oxidase subunit II n=1 Tax=Pseudanabaena sp. FACHB-2040 TaxID=2692859 RepID=UPI0016896AD4|nr:cytochrome c oxidase subunit II [Pseudanabaena sp. FACHB-2040]MBD2258161.1 cytochrome c oxidase subunit II [Pseudanabaena sp. FACHB-2040]
MKQIPAPIWTLVIGVVVTLVSIWAGYNHHILPTEQASSTAPLVDNFFNVMVMIGTALFLMVEGAIVFSMIKFRQPKGDETDGLPIEGNLPLEAFWTAIPAVICIALGVYSVFVFQEMGGFAPGDHAHGHGTLMAQAPAAIVTDVGSPMITEGDIGGQKIPVYGFGASPEEEGNAPDLAVNVTGLQFAWVFTYPDSGITDGELHVPVGKDVQVNLTAQDVIHSFWIPQFRLKQDAMPGQTAELRFVPTKPGTYSIVCAELCGAYHGAMRTQVIVHTEEDFSHWLESRTATSPQSSQTVAINPAERSDADYLAAYSQGLDLDAQLVSQLAHSPH